MADVQTQTIDQSEVTSQDVDLQARASAFKNDLSDIRAMRIESVEKMRGLYEAILNSKYAIDDLYTNFHTEAVAMYPELTVRDVFEVMKTMDFQDPLVLMWENYSGKIKQAQLKMDMLVSDFNVEKEHQAALGQQEADVFNMYSIFANENAGYVPTPEEMSAELQAVDTIPMVEEGSVIARQVPAIENLNPSAADLVTLQVVSDETGYDAHDVREGLEKSMFAEPTSDVTTQVVESAKKNWHLILGALAIGYILFGGKD